MEKIMSVEEKIRRAEEIYNRRNGNSYNYSTFTPKEKKQPSFMHRMIKQIIICFMIYGIFYVVTNREYFLSQEFQGKVKEVASHNEVLNNTYNYIMGYIEKYFNNNEDKDESSEKEKEKEQQNNEAQNQGNNTSVQEEEKQSNQENLEKVSDNDIQNNDENIGGSDEILTNKEDEEEKTQEQKDVEEIKSKISFINPIQGTISSTFGWRTPTTSTVPKYHTGLDIAAKTGTVIKSATDGKVILVSSEGDYGKHYKIQIDDIIIIYAHCSKLYLKEGDTVSKGQEIAEVGSTGNSTRATFAF